MADINIIPMYVEGQTVHVPEGQIYNQFQLEDFLTRDFTRLGHNHKRIGILAELNAKELADSNMVKIYNQYLGKFDQTTYSVGKSFTTHIGDIYQYADLIDELLLECSSRMPIEFDYNGKDPEWYTFGEVMILIHEPERNRVVGFAALGNKYEGMVSLNMLYVKPEYRGNGYAKALLEYAYKYGQDHWSRGERKDQFLMKIATDTTENNYLNALLHKLNFKLYKHYWRTR